MGHLQILVFCKSSNFSLLYVFGEVMGLDMATRKGKLALCGCFVDKEGNEIEVMQIKRRSESSNTKKFRTDLSKIIDGEHYTTPNKN